MDLHAVPLASKRENPLRSNGCRQSCSLFALKSSLKTVFLSLVSLTLFLSAQSSPESVCFLFNSVDNFSIWNLVELLIFD